MDANKSGTSTAGEGEGKDPIYGSREQKYAGVFMECSWQLLLDDFRCLIIAKQAKSFHK